MHFDYREFNDAGSVIDKEQGIVPDLSFTLGQRQSDWEWEGISSYQRGQLPYDGHTNTGQLYGTRTDETITDIALRLGCWLGNTRSVMPYAGLGYRRWDRNILPGFVGTPPSPISGLPESYRWNYLWLGVKPVLIQYDSSQLALDMGLIKPLKTEMRFDAQGSSLTLYPAGKVGLRILLTLQKRLAENTFMTMEPYYEYWELGRSPAIISGGYIHWEPASKTRNFGLRLRFDWTLQD